MAAVLFLLLTAGCAGKVANTYKAEGYDPLAADGARYAVGGFVLGARAQLDRQAEYGTAAENADRGRQTDAWAPLLYGPLSAGRSDLIVWPWPAVRDNLPADGITALQEAYARGSVLPAGLVTALAADLPEVTYLVLARIDRNEIEIGENMPTATGVQPNSDGREPYDATSQMTRTIKTRRTVAVTLDVFELSSGRSVWTGTAERNQTDLYSSNEKSGGDDLVVTPATEAGAPPEIRVKGASLDMPDLDGVLAEACAALVGNLFAKSE